MTIWNMEKEEIKKTLAEQESIKKDTETIKKELSYLSQNMFYVKNIIEDIRDRIKKSTQVPTLL